MFGVPEVCLHDIIILLNKPAPANLCRPSSKQGGIRYDYGT
jgi:hypothetical protein